MGKNQKHGKKARGSRMNRKAIVKEILIRVTTEGSSKILPFLILSLDLLDDGQINGSILADAFS